VVGVVVMGVVVVGAVTEVDVVLLLVLPFGALALRRAAVGVEQPSAESATPTKRASTQVADHFLNPFERFTSRPRIKQVPVVETEDQLASWTTSASPTLA
jgi:hypothetical protein